MFWPWKMILPLKFSDLTKETLLKKIVIHVKIWKCIKFLLFISSTLLHVPYI